MHGSLLQPQTITPRMCCSNRFTLLRSSLKQALNDLRSAAAIYAVAFMNALLRSSLVLGGHADLQRRDDLEPAGAIRGSEKSEPRPWASNKSSM